MDEQLITKYIKTKNKLRKIVTYREYGELRKYHEEVVRYLNKHTKPSIFAKAYYVNTSIYINAKAHMYNDIFLKMDIKDFFSNINHKYLAERLFFEINLNTKISRKECYDIVKKCSVSSKGLPLGLVSSPALANIYMKEFDGLLYGELKKMGLDHPIYTRYADDMIVSFKDMPNYEEKIEHIKLVVEKLLKRVHLVVNRKKTEIFNLERSNHVRITGVNVTKDINNYRHLSVGRKMKKNIFWETIKIHDQKIKNHSEIARLKGMYSYVLSIEKKGIEECYSDNMKKLIFARGYNSLDEMISKLGKRN